MSTSTRHARILTTALAAAALVLSPVAAFAIDADPGQDTTQPVATGEAVDSSTPQEGAEETPEAQAGEEQSGEVDPVEDPQVGEEAVGDEGAVEDPEHLADEPPVEVREAEAVTVNLLAITDFHGHLIPTSADPGAGALSCQFNASSVGYDKTFRVSAGDNIGGSAFVSAVQDDDPTIDILNALGLDVSAVGNHEFDLGADILAKRISGEERDPALVEKNGWNVNYSQPDFPHVGANIDAPGVLPYVILHDAGTGLNVAFIGGVTDELPSLVSPSGIAGLTITDPVTTMNNTADSLKSTGEADLVVGLIHKDMAVIANAVSTNVDAIFGGHSHVTYTSGTPVPSVQAGSYGQDLGQIVLTVDPETKTVLSATEAIIGSDTIKACVDHDPVVAELEREAAAKAQELGARRVAQVAGPFYRGNAVLVEGTAPADARGAESTMGNLLANAVRESSTKYLADKADIGIINAGGIRADLLPDAEGWLTMEQLRTAQPFNNSMAYVDLTGSQVKEMLEEQWQPEGSSRPVLKLGLSDNVSYVFDAARAAGDRILSITVNGAPIDPSVIYRVAGNSFLLDGGDNFNVFKQVSAINTGFIDLDAFIAYLTEVQPIANPFDLRDSAIGVDSTQVGQILDVGEDYVINLSSLSFTEDPMHTAEVSVCIEGAAGPIVLSTAEVNNEDAVEGIYVARTDQFGVAQVEFTIPEDAPGDAEVYVCNLVSDFAKTATHELTIGHTPAKEDPSPSPDPSTAGPTSSPSVSVTVHPSGTTTTKAGPKLASTGANEGLIFGSLAFLIVGAGALGLARLTRRQ